MMHGSPGTKLAPERGFMAMSIFFLLNGIGVVFLLYVLANFWKEGHRPNNPARPCAAEFLRRGVEDVFVVTHPISHSAYGGLSVLPMQAREFGQDTEEDYRCFVDELEKTPIETSEKPKRLSTR